MWVWALYAALDRDRAESARVHRAPTADVNGRTPSPRPGNGPHLLGRAAGHRAFLRRFGLEHTSG
ncbi:hypothetical protein IQ63_32085 [Streptomyces acidiscabies]|uniref:Uncharacterized protein n=1 Tax=Streptomyces acidiscabies TaxID=42234 RepID=A0A0L0JTY8_9ACTN|nr:hypothetical protein IQ63_32085 [Streptomyces acidiscabies]